MVQLLDQYGRPIQKQALTSEQAAPSLMGVRRPVGNHQAPGLTPPKLARILRKALDGDPEAYLELAEDMEERNEHYAGVLGIRKRQVSGLEVTVEAAGDDAESIKDADLVRDFISRPCFEDELFDILDAIGKGFSRTEIIWDTSESQWRIKELKWRDPRWFRFKDEDGETSVLRGLNGDEELSPGKWICHNAKIKSGLPIRGGIARSAAWAYMFKTFSVSDWGIFTEAYGQPMRIGKYDPNATEKQKQDLMRAVANIGADFAAIIPESMMMEIIKAEISGSSDLYERKADWHDRQISKLVLGQTGTTDAQAGGYAVGKVHDGVREDIERADARQLAASLMRDVVVCLVNFNHGPRKKYPIIKIGRPDQVDITALVDQVVKLVPLGLKVGMATMRDRIGLPDPGQDEEILTPSRAATTELDLTAPPADQPQATAVNSQALRPVAADAIDKAVSDIVGGDWEMLVDPVVAGLEDQLGAAKSVEEAQAILKARLDTLGTNKLAEMLARASFAARLAGENDEQLA